MSHSLRSKIKCLRYKGIITDKDCDRLRKALDNEDVLNKIRDEIKDRPSLMMSTSKEYERGVNAMLYQALSIIDKYRKEQE